MRKFSGSAIPQLRSDCRCGAWDGAAGVSGSAIPSQACLPTNQALQTSRSPTPRRRSFAPAARSSAKLLPFFRAWPQRTRSANVAAATRSAPAHQSGSARYLRPETRWGVSAAEMEERVSPKGRRPSRKRRSSISVGDAPAWFVRSLVGAWPAHQSGHIKFRSITAPPLFHERGSPHALRYRTGQARGQFGYGSRARLVGCVALPTNQALAQ